MTSPRVDSLPGAHNITRVRLTNGITVLVYENHAAQSVVLMGSLAAGSRFEDPARAGLAAFTAGALMRGAEGRDFDAINEALESIGADLDVSAGVHRATFFGKALAEDLPTVLDVLADVLRRPSFPAPDVERLRGEIVTSLQIRQHDTRYRATRALYENVYPPAHPYHRGTRGTLETVPTLAIDELRAFHRRVFGPRGMILVVVGAVDARAAIDAVRARFESWHNVEQPPVDSLPEVPSLAMTRRVRVPIPGKTQADVVLGVAGPPRRAPDYHAAVLTNSILGQFGMMGRIGQIVREQLGLAYYAGSSIEGGHGPGPWSIAAGVNPVNLDLAVERILDEVRRLVREPVADEELSDVQSYYTGHLPLQLESNEGIAGTILNIETFDLGLDYLLTYRDRIRALTPADLLAATQRYLNPDALVIASAGPD